MKSPATGGGNPADGIDCKCSIKDLFGESMLMKIFDAILLSCLMVCVSGCVSSRICEKARGSGTVWHKDEKGNMVSVYGVENPGYYCWLPLTVPVDVATSPIQIPVIIWEKSVGLDKIH